MSTALFGLKLVLNALFPIPWLVLALLAFVRHRFRLLSGVISVDGGCSVPHMFSFTGQVVCPHVHLERCRDVGRLDFWDVIEYRRNYSRLRHRRVWGLLGTLFIQCFVPGEAKRAPAAESLEIKGIAHRYAF